MALTGPPSAERMKLASRPRLATPATRGPRSSEEGGICNGEEEQRWSHDRGEEACYEGAGRTRSGQEAQDRPQDHEDVRADRKEIQNTEAVSRRPLCLGANALPNHRLQGTGRMQGGSRDMVIPGTARRRPRSAPAAEMRSMERNARPPPSVQPERPLQNGENRVSASLDAVLSVPVAPACAGGSVPQAGAAAAGATDRVESLAAVHRPGEEARVAW